MSENYFGISEKIESRTSRQKLRSKIWIWIRTQPQIQNSGPGPRNKARTQDLNGRFLMLNIFKTKEQCYCKLILVRCYGGLFLKFDEEVMPQACIYDKEGLRYVYQFKSHKSYGVVILIDVIFFSKKTLNKRLAIQVF